MDIKDREIYMKKSTRNLVIAGGILTALVLIAKFVLDKVLLSEDYTISGQGDSELEDIE